MNVKWNNLFKTFFQSPFEICYKCFMPRQMRLRVVLASSRLAWPFTGVKKKIHMTNKPGITPQVEAGVGAGLR